VRARLENMKTNQEFHFLCVEKMAKKMDKVVNLGGGEIFEKDVKSYGVVISVRKKS